MAEKKSANKKKSNNKSNKKLIGIICGIVAGVVALALILFFTLTGNQDQVVTYKLKQYGAEISLTYYAKGDRVYKQTAKNIIPYSVYGVETAEEAEELIGDLLAEANNIEGYTDEVEYTKDSVIETVTIDYEVVDINKIKDLQGAYLSEGDIQGGVSLSESIKFLEKNGFEKVK